ncbi:hypothetical protein ABZ876_08315 [Streptomyces sp. NPDC046931]|uniref:DUF6197 family protein n=1 Tax=Streptomyces sp. NPDC046931 TaxID=3154806 RepID=UPI0033C40E96
MTTLTRAPATRPPDLTLDERLALASLAMDERCTLAVLAVDVNSAHIPAEPLPEITVPYLPQTVVPAPYTTPLAALLHRARIRLETDGWTRDALVDEQGQRCPIGAIRVEASSRRQADDACVLLLEAIRRDFADETIPAWNARQTGAAPVLLYLGRAAELGHARGL